RVWWSSWLRKDTSDRAADERRASERSEASHASGARRRSGAGESVLGSPRGEAPRIRLEVKSKVVKIMSRDVSAPLSTNQHLLRWVRKMADLARPKAIHWVDGSQEEYDLLCDE